MIPLKIFLLLLLVVTVICSNERYYNYNKGMFLYGQDDFYDDDDYGDDIVDEWEENDNDGYGYDDYDDDDDDVDRGYDEYKKYDNSWDKHYDDDDDYDDDKKKKHHHEKTEYFHAYKLPAPYTDPPMIVTKTLRPHHHGNFHDGYDNGYRAGFEDPDNCNHTIEYLKTSTDCGITKRVDVIDGSSYTFSTFTTVGPEGVTRTEVNLDGTTILLPYTGADKMMSTIPLQGVTRTVVEVENDATTLPLRIRPTPPPIPPPPSPPPPPQRMLDELVPPPPFLSPEDVMYGRRLALDDMPYGKSLAVGDDGIGATVLRFIRFDKDGNPIIPSIAGTRPVYVINDRTTTLRNGIPPLFPVDNGHTQTVVALRSGVLTLPLTGGDEITKLLPIDGLTETVVVFDERTYTLSPDDETATTHQPLPSKIVHTVVVEEILSSYPPTPSPSPSPTPSPPALKTYPVAPSAAAATTSGIVGAAAAIRQLLHPHTMADDDDDDDDADADERVKNPDTLFNMPPKTIVHAQPTTITTTTTTTDTTDTFSDIPEATPSSPSIPSSSSPSIPSSSSPSILSSSPPSIPSSSPSSIPSPSPPSIPSPLPPSISSSSSTSIPLSSSTTSSVSESTASTFTVSPLSSSSPSSSSSLSFSSFSASSSSSFFSVATSAANASETIPASIPPGSPSHCPTKWMLEDAATSEGCYMLSSVVAIDSAMRHVDQQGGAWTASQCHGFCANSTQIQQLPSQASWYYGLTISAAAAAAADDDHHHHHQNKNVTTTSTSTCRCLEAISGAHSMEMQACRTTTATTTDRLGLVYSDTHLSSTIYIYQATYRCLLPSLKKKRAWTTTTADTTTAIAAPEAWQCDPDALVVNKRASEGCYPYLTPKVTVRKSRTNANGTGWYWTAARCYSYCVQSGRVPSRGSWYYGITLSDAGLPTIQNSCLCMLDMGQPPLLNTTDGCQTLEDNDTKVGRVDTHDINAAAIYAYQVNYTCAMTSCNHTTNTTSMISDPKAVEGCYTLSNYAHHVVKKQSRTLSQKQGAYTPEECFQFCNDSGAIVQGQPWWYGISMTDPADKHKLGTTVCHCSIQPPSLSHYDILAGRCNKDNVGLVDSRFLYRITNGVYVYKVSYQCPL